MKILRSNRLFVAIFAVLIALVVNGATMIMAQDSSTELRGSKSIVRELPQSMEAIRYSYAPLVKKAAPAVVNVYAAVRMEPRSSPFAGDPFFEQFFGPNAFGRQRRRSSQSLGSGVIVGEDGIVITNHHVIKNASEVKVALADGREFSAEIKLVDERSDLAVLKMETDELFPIVPLGDAEDLEVGDLVLALGNPFGVGQTVTSGIVSALARSQRGKDDFGFFIQTDASINPGNSGGALIDMRGRLIGINTSIFTRSGGSNGIGFAVPSNMVKVVLDSVRQGSDVLLRPWIGASFQTVTPDIASSLGLPRPSGALVSKVMKGGPAEKAGLQLGDVVLRIDGKTVEHVDALGYRFTTAGNGREVELTVLSRNNEKKVALALMPAPEDPPRDLRVIGGRSPFTGAQVANLSPRVAQELRIPTTISGVVIVGVDPRSPARRFGFQPGDILIEINEQEITNTRMLDRLVRSNRRGWGYILERNGRRFSRFIR